MRYLLCSKFLDIKQSGFAMSCDISSLDSFGVMIDTYLYYVYQLE